MARSALQIFQEEDPAGYQVLVVASQLTRSDKIDSVRKMVLYAEIASRVKVH